MRPILYIKSIFLAGLAILLLFLSCKNNSGDDNLLILTGKVVSRSTCKNLKLAGGMADTPDTLSCIHYSFNNLSGKLQMKHLNAGFNCCPDSIYCMVNFSGDTIIVREFEKKSGCKCNCLYDLDIEISGLAAKAYPVRLEEPYGGTQQRLIFTMDLAKVTEGSVCVVRRLYPWGF